jgi:hypothetical protein
LIEPRIYRAAFAPALLAAVVAMFSLQSRPPSVQQALAADVLFDGRVALTDARRLASAQPDRRAGADGDLLTAGRVAERLRSEHFTVTVDRFEDEGEDLVNVFGRRVGASTRQVVVVAARDALHVPDLAGSAADTAALTEIARTLEGRATNKTVVLASVDGSMLGSAGARRLAGQLRAAGPVEAVIVISDLAVPKARGSLLVPWSNGSVRTGLRLQRTLSESIRLEVESGGAGRGVGTGAQLARLAFPLGIGDQAPLLDAHLDAMRVSGSGELPPDRQVQPDPDRLGSLGRATLRALFAYDAGGRVSESPSSFVVVAQKILPRWAVSLVVLSLLLPLLAAAVDGFARVRRRHEPVLPWLRWLLAGLVPFALALAVAELLSLAGQAPDPPPAPVPPERYPLDGAAAVSLGVCTLVFVLAWIFVRPRLAGRLPAAGTPGAAAALALLLAAVAVAVWAVNPFAALALLPAFHVWLLATASRVPPRRPAAVVAVLGGLVLPLAVWVAVLARLSVDPLTGAWYLFVLVVGHHIGLYSTVAAALVAVCLAGALAIVLARRPEPRAPSGPPVRGPRGYAGPGSLGGTDSALGR